MSIFAILLHISTDSIITNATTSSFSSSSINDHNYHKDNVSFFLQQQHQQQRTHQHQYQEINDSKKDHRRHNRQLLLFGSLLRKNSVSMKQPNDDIVKFTCNDTEDTIKSRDASSVRRGLSTIYIGTNQVSSINQDPIIIRFNNNGIMMWCQTKYEVSGADSRGIGLLWGGGYHNRKQRLYAIFTTDGTQGTTIEDDFRRYTINGWLNSYGQGGGPKVSVILQINPNNGNGIHGTFLRAELENGNTNTLVVKDIKFISRNTKLQISADSYFYPLQSNRSRYTNVSNDCTKASSPFDYNIIFNLD